MCVEETRQSGAETALTVPQAIATFTALVRSTFPGMSMEIDAPAADDGGWWIDVASGSFRTTLLWQQGHGFGVFTSEEGYGDRPDETYRTPERAFRRFGQLVETHRRDAGIHPLQLRDVRALVGIQQATVADRMHVKQAAVSKLEARQDMKLSTVASYVAALGGRVEMRVVFDDFAVNVVLPEEETEAV